MGRQHVLITLDGPNAEVRGWPGKRLIEQVSGRPPVWLSRRRCFTCQSKTAIDAAALAERLGYRVTVSGVAQQPSASPPVPATATEAGGECHETGGRPAVVRPPRRTD